MQVNRDLAHLPLEDDGVASFVNADLVHGSPLNADAARALADGVLAKRYRERGRGRWPQMDSQSGRESHPIGGEGDQDEQASHRRLLIGKRR